MPFYGLYIPVKGGAQSTSGAAGSPGNGNVTAATAATAGAILGAAASNGGGNNEHNNSAGSPYVFRAKTEALEVLKKMKDGRVREFINEDDAVKYAETGYEVVQTKYADAKASNVGLEKAAFRGPTKQELVEFRKKIETGDYERVQAIIWDNPRYLVSSGDTPTTLKEGYRYNAMHVCAISNKPRIAELILQTVSNAQFVDLMTGKKNDTKMTKELCMNLLDYYLNIPEKGRSETPLHLAAKTGAVEMIEVLTSYPECRMTPNKDGQMPKDIICSRCATATPELSKKIESLLEERFYVPVLRSMDDAVPPQIGEPFSSSNPPELNTNILSPEVKIQALAGPMNKEQATQFRLRWKTPPRLGSNTTSPIVNSLFISPMKLYTPPRTPRSDSFGTPTGRRALFHSSSDAAVQYKEQNTDDIDGSIVGVSDLTDDQNGNHTDNDEAANIPGNEANNNNNTNQHQELPVQDSSAKNLLKSLLLPKTPIWKINPTAFFNYREPNVPSPVVFDAAFNSVSPVNNIDHFDSPGYKERHIKIADPEKGLEIIGRELAKEQNVEWREYWDFLNAFIDIASSEGLQKLEIFFAQRAKEAEVKKKGASAVSKSVVVLGDLCNALEKFGFAKNGYDQLDGVGSNSNRMNRGNNVVSGTTGTPTTTPYTCVEKSVQVFAKRITKMIIHNIENIVSINDTLLSELKRLKSLIFSFKEDVRFIDVDFSKVHSRIGNLISIYLTNSQEVNEDVRNTIKKIVRSLLETVGERREHLDCVCLRMLNMLERPIDQILPENLKTETMCSKVWLQEIACDCQWDNNLSRKSSRRSRFEARYKNTHAKMQQLAKHNAKALQAANGEDWQSVSSSSDDEDDVFLTDLGSDSDDDVWQTPPESPTSLTVVKNIEEDDYNIYVCGNEPTKRDLDVLNAIFHIDLDKNKYPNIHAWKTALLRYPNEEMDYFPSPAVIKKSQSFITQSPGKRELPLTPYPYLKEMSKLAQSQLASSVKSEPTPTTSLKSQQFKYMPTKQHRQEPNPLPKRLFMSPRKSAENKQPQEQQQQNSGYVTPLNKIRGLFSAYRDRTDNTPSSASSSPSSLLATTTEDDNSSNESKNLSLLNVSSMQE